MQQNGQASFPQVVQQAKEPLCMIGMPMTQDNGLNAPKVHTRQFQVVQGPIGCYSGIKQDGFSFPLVENGDQQGDPMLGTN